MNPYPLMALLALAVAAPVTVAADEPAGSRIYRTVDDQGRVRFSDQAPAGGNAVDVTPRTLNVMPSSSAVEQWQARQDAAEAVVEAAAAPALRIVSPADQATFRNPDQPVPIRVAWQGEGLRTEVSVNGAVVTKLELPMERGSYLIEARLVDADGRVQLSADPVTVYVHRTTVHQRPVAPPPPKPKPTPTPTPTPAPAPKPGA